MAGELHGSYLTGVTLYVQVFNESGQVWRTDTSVFETPQNVNWAAYDVPLMEAGTTGIYRGDTPVAGAYNYVVYRQAGGAPAVGDPVIGTGNYGREDSADLTAIKARTDLIPNSPAVAGGPATLSSGERNAIAVALLDLVDGVEEGETLRQNLRLVRSVLAGKSLETDGTLVFYRKDGETEALTAVHTSEGSRSSVEIGEL